MEKMRTSFQGVWNIIRFNWTCYAGGLVFVVIALFVAPMSDVVLQWIIAMGVAAALFGIVVSLGVSNYIYDCSGIYDLPWIDELKIQPEGVVLNISAGFDETTEVLKSKIPAAEFHIWDFYDSDRNTEISIKRARAAYPAHPDTRSVHVEDLPMGDGQADLICLNMAAHEIRDQRDRVKFFSELHRILKDKGVVCVTEHLRDFPNCIVYNFGAMHFYSKAEWLRVFQAAGFALVTERKMTPFLSTFVLGKVMDSLATEL